MVREARVARKAKATTPNEHEQDDAEQHSASDADVAKKEKAKPKPKGGKRGQAAAAKEPVEPLLEEEPENEEVKRSPSPVKRGKKQAKAAERKDNEPVEMGADGDQHMDEAPPMKKGKKQQPKAQAQAESTTPSVNTSAPVGIAKLLSFLGSRPVLIELLVDSFQTAQSQQNETEQEDVEAVAQFLHSNYNQPKYTAKH